MIDCYGQKNMMLLLPYHWLHYFRSRFCLACDGRYLASSPGPLDLPAFNVARKKREGLVRNITRETSQISERGLGGAALTTKMHSK
jgi:hypothetical protein